MWAYKSGSYRKMAKIMTLVGRVTSGSRKIHIEF
jgi:hypothetical protein